MITLIAAIDRHRAIGRDNALPWHLPIDLKRFKALTIGKPVLMGRKTAEALGRALPGRRNLVLTRSAHAPFSGMQTVHSIEHALDLIGADELMVIGGGEVYALALPLAGRMHLTHVDTVVADADVFFPDFNPLDWTIGSPELHAADERHAFSFEFIDYQRRSRSIARAA